MKGCLNCQKEYENKREASKFCSTKCRVMYNRKFPKKKDGVSKTQLQVIYNAILEKVGELKAAPQTFSIKPQMPVVQHISQAKTFTQYNQAKIDCQSEEEWVGLAHEIENDQFLPRKQKNILLNKS